MYKIAICDDELLSIDKNEEIVRKFFRNEDVSVTRYSDSEELLENPNEINKIDILLMDIVLKNDNGIDVSKRVLKVNPLVQIIFISSYRDFIESSYEAEHIWYVLKEHRDTILEKALEKAKEKVDSKNSKGIVIMQSGLAKTILLKNIFYMEQDKRKTKIFTKQGDFEEYKTLNHYEETLKDFQFVRCHKSFIVNMDEVEVIGKTKLVLLNGTEISVSRSYKGRVHDYLEQIIKAR